MSHASKKPILGILGGIGSGKSTVAAELARRGGFLIVGDHLGHEALRQRDIRDKVAERFGREVLDEQGNVERRKLGALVFADPAELQALEELVFPFIERRIREEIAVGQQNNQARFIVLDAAVMLEAGWAKVCDKLIFVDAPRSVRLERLAQKHGWNEKEVDEREQMQLDLSVKKAKADFVIDNGQASANVADHVGALLQRLGLT